MPGPDPDHWLHRLTADEWLRAARNELRRAEEALLAKQQRAGVVGARRAAGMAWNAVLVAAPDDRYGRSYMELMQAMVDDEAIPDAIRRAARSLIDAPLAQTVIALGRGDTSLARAAEAIVELAAARVHPTASA
jgi:HEPN domain-containing protein